MRVKSLAQEHNTMSRARARTRNARSGDERANHERANHIRFIKDRIIKSLETVAYVIDDKATLWGVYI